MKKIVRLALIASASIAHAAFAGSVTTRMMVDTVRHQTESEARSSLQKQAKFQCMSGTGESASVSIDASTVKCKQSGKGINQWFCRAQADCTRSGPNVGKKNTNKGGARPM